MESLVSLNASLRNLPLSVVYRNETPLTHSNTVNSPNYRTYSNLRISVAFLLIFSAIGTSGCVSRRVVIRTEPEGAAVAIDGMPQGYSPVAVPYVYGGSRDFQIELDGYETIKERVNLSDPWYLRPPVSFLTENFSPVEIRHQPVVDFQLQPKSRVNGALLMQRANTLRNNVQRGTVTAPAR